MIPFLRALLALRMPTRPPVPLWLFLLILAGLALLAWVLGPPK